MFVLMQIMEDGYHSEPYLVGTYNTLADAQEVMRELYEERVEEAKDCHWYEPEWDLLNDMHAIVSTEEGGGVQFHIFDSND